MQVSRNAHAAVGPALLRLASLLERRGLTAPPPALSGAASDRGRGGSPDTLSSPRASWTTPAPALRPAAASPPQRRGDAADAVALAAAAAGANGEPLETPADSALALLPPPGSAAAMEARLQRRWRALVDELLEDAAVRADAADEFSALLLALSPAATSATAAAAAAAAARAAKRGASGVAGAAGASGAADQPDAHSVLRLLLRHASTQLDALSPASEPSGTRDGGAARRMGGGAAASAGAGAGVSTEAPGEQGRAAREASLARVLQLLHTLPTARDAPRLRGALVATLVEAGAVRLVLRLVGSASLSAAVFEQAGSRYQLVRRWTYTSHTAHSLTYSHTHLLTDHGLRAGRAPRAPRAA